MARAEYSSSRRSRMLIRSALVALMQDKDFDKITITEITRKAGVNRGTFYAHYKNISEVMESIQSEVANDLSQIFRGVKMSNLLVDAETILTNCINYIKKEPEYYRMLMSVRSGKTIVDLWKNNIIGYLESSTFFGEHSRYSSSYKCALNFVINGTVESIIDSLVGHSTVMLEALPKELARFITRVLEPYFS